MRVCEVDLVSNQVSHKCIFCSICVMMMCDGGKGRGTGEWVHKAKQRARKMCRAVLLQYK